jgi:hypothetical protein
VIDARRCHVIAHRRQRIVGDWALLVDFEPHRRLGEILPR